MAVSLVTVFGGPRVQVVDVIATADADTSAVIPLTLGTGSIGASAIPAEVYMTPMLSQALAASSAWAWFYQSTPTINVSLTKLASAGSGSAAVQLRVVIKSPQAPNAVFNPNQAGASDGFLQPLGL